MVAPRRRGVPGRGRLAGRPVAGVAAALLAGCAGHAVAADGSAGASSSPAVVVQDVQGGIGPIVVGDGYVPEPASPDVAAAYLTIVDDGDSPVRLTSVSADVAARVMPMTERTDAGVGRMAPLGDVVVPAHGAYRFSPGAAHLMLEQPSPVPVAGGEVTLSLTFEPGGTVTVSLPVTPLGAPDPSEATATG
jgi:copper(I)-binding protein